mmetsp:Transcript_13740/g.27629  ORF Transcript_13740/g.27629 Transcript_13740/m.27629 type:complete len:124 (-) Transcript_13740:406-777(-)
MPLIVLDPSFSNAIAGVSFGVPLAFYIFAKDVLEPVVIGKGTSLKPVTVLLAILIYGSVWGITGMVMAVPMTAVLRIYLSNSEHFLAQFVASKLSGEKPAYARSSRTNSNSTKASTSPHHDLL